MGKSIAIITARGGSKRIPGKNIRDFCGRPILAYSIEAALASKAFEEVMVSTDDMKIAAVAKAYGAGVPFLRTPEASDDYATTADVLTEVLGQYQAMGKEFQYGCCIYPTAPFVTAEKLRRAMGLLGDEVYSVIPVTEFSFPPMRGMRLEHGNLAYVFPEFCSMRSQDIPPMYHDCGQFYCFRVDKFLEAKTLMTAHTKAVVVPEMEVQDIDNEQDWKIAEMKYKYMHQHRGAGNALDETCVDGQVKDRQRHKMADKALE